MMVVIVRNVPELHVTISLYNSLLSRSLIILPSCPSPLSALTWIGRYNGKENGKEIWLGILGEVYNVTLGDMYYASESGYHIFAGKDATVPFVTGKFTEDGAQESTDVLSPGELYEVEQWREFYEKEKKYNYLGKLVGRFYDAEGKPTEEMGRFHERLATYEHPQPQKRKTVAEVKAEKQAREAAEAKAAEAKAAAKGDGEL